jgi:glycosyltransferase involved in cell wall biosynthesis
MDWTSGCVAVIPCLNEAGSIGAVVAGVRKHLPTVLVVDDGSVDGTDGVARAAGAEVIRHSRCQGKGAAIRSGLCLGGGAGRRVGDAAGRRRPA